MGEVVRVALQERQVRVSRPGAPDHLWREVDSNTMRWAQGCKQLAVARTYFEDAQAWRTKEPEHFFKAAVIGSTQASFGLGPDGNSIPVSGSHFPVGDRGTVKLFG